MTTHLSLKALKHQPLLVLLLCHGVQLMALDHSLPSLTLQANRETCSPAMLAVSQGLTNC